MRGGYDSIIEQGWQQYISRDKVFYINNGVDLGLLDYNKNNLIILNKDLNDENIFKVIYTGSIRKVNNSGRLLDIAKEVKNTKVKFLVWGDGNELPTLRKRIKDEKIMNVILKGKVEKKFIPYITSKADLNYAHNSPNSIFRFGMSFNKIFDYLAARKPILCDFQTNYYPVIMGNAGVVADSANAKKCCF